VDVAESRKLIEDLRAGDAEAFRRVYAAERAFLYGFLLRLSRDPNVAADLFQNTWLKLARGHASLRADTQIRAWLLTVARNEYLSYCRAQTLDMSRLLTLFREVDRGAARDTVEGDLDAVEAALGELGDRDREVLLLVAIDGLDARAAARALGLSYAAFRQRLARARQRFAERLTRMGIGTRVFEPNRGRP
jgi:RNA polymerase sigma-70 factor (ECF subfamily)